jgi:hypothetical protein
MSGVLQGALRKRMSGDRPSPVQAALTSIVAGTAAAVLTYRLMRS